jgi:predicted peptidase
MKKIISLFLAVIMAFTIVTPTVVSAASKKVSKPKISSVSALSSTSVKLKWKKVSGADGYVIYQKKGDGKYTSIKTITSGKTTYYTKKSLSTATKYTYKIKAYDKVGSKKIYSDYSSAKSVYTNPSKVTISSVSDVSASSIKINWKKVYNADGYVIYQKKGDGKYTLIKTITSGKTTSYTKNSLSGASKYTYKIKAYVKSGSSKIYGEYSSAKSTYTKPSQVTVASLTAVSPTSVKISWKKVYNANGYVIYQNKGDGKYTLIKTITSGQTTTYTKSGLSSSTKYTYKIKAYVKSGSSTIYGSYSTAKSITTPAITQDNDNPTPNPDTPTPTPPEEEIINLGALTQTASGVKGPEMIKEIVTLTGRTEFTKPTFTKAKHSSTGLEYYYYKPTTPAPADGYPVFLYLHGTNQSSDVFASMSNLWTHNFDILKDAVIIAPVWTGGMNQSSLDGFWSPSGNAVTLIKQIANKNIALGGSLLNIDKNRIYIGGYSAGGIATFREVANNDGFFAAAVPMAGAVTGAIINDDTLKTTPIWAWHGSADTTVGYDFDFDFLMASKGIYNKIGSAGKMRFTTLDGGVHGAAPYSASLDRRLWSWLFAQNKATNQSLNYEITPYVKVVDSDGKTVFSELDCSAVAYDTVTNQFSMTMTAAGRTKLSNAYTASNGKPFTIYYGSKKIVTFTATDALSNDITKFVIKDVFGDNYIDTDLVVRVNRNINKNKLSKTAISETLYGNG